VTDAKVIKIGELLVSAGLLDTSDVIEAIQVSHRLQIPVGRVLIMAGTVTEHLLQASLQAQIVINEGLVSVDVAGEALRLVTRDQKTLEQALQQLNVAPDYQRDLSNHLADLLLDSNIVSQEQLDQAMQTSNEADIPLSGALVLQGVLSANFFPSILRAHDQIRSGQMQREEAIEELKSSFLIWLKADESWNSNSNGLHGDSSDQLTNEAEIFVSNSEFTVPEVEQAATSNSEVFQSSTPRLIELLKQAGVCTQHDVQKAYDGLLADPHLSGRVFLAMGVTDEQTLQFALRCHGLIKKGLLTEEQAVQAIRSTRSGMVSQAEALVEQTSEQHRYFDPTWRNKTLRAFGGGLFGALVAGIALSKTFKGR
jgi:hypothetical protein